LVRLQHLPSRKIKHKTDLGWVNLNKLALWKKNFKENCDREDPKVMILASFASTYTTLSTITGVGHTTDEQQHYLRRLH
jgi:hypothetical protein